jgi:hypothetical protein
MQTLKAYSVMAADHLNNLLGRVPLSTKAREMSDALYAGILGPTGFPAEPQPPGIFTPL